MRACVIGGGVSGLAAIKECNASGIHVVAFEKTQDIGGIWNYRPELKEGGMLMKSSISNTSKEMMAYSDFPPPENNPNFMHHSMVQQYLRDYAEQFDLVKDIRFGETVDKLERVGDKWEVTTSKGQKELFDFTMICSGHRTHMNSPQLKGVENFQGRVLHSRDYHEPREFKDKNVFIIGLGDSATDIAVELVHHAKSVTISTRRGAWIGDRLGSGGIPQDVALNSRFYSNLFGILPWTVLNDYMERRSEFNVGHDNFGLRPCHRWWQQRTNIAGQLPNLLCSGRIVITEDVVHVDAGGVVVEGGHRFPADVIIYATGYSVKFPYLSPESLIPVKDNEMNLYKSMFAPGLSSLAVIGMVEPLGLTGPISEMQCRLAVAVFKRRVALPSRHRMSMDIDRVKDIRNRRYYNSPRNALQVDYMTYMDELAGLLKCKPRLCKYVFKDPHFAMRLYFGVNAPYAYRLQGKGRWIDAKNTLKGLPDRVKKPMKNRECDTMPYKKDGSFWHMLQYISLKTGGQLAIALFVALIWAFFSSTPGHAASQCLCAFMFLNICAFTSILWCDRQFNVVLFF